MQSCVSISKILQNLCCRKFIFTHETFTPSNWQLRWDRTEQKQKNVFYKFKFTPLDLSIYETSLLSLATDLLTSQIYCCQHSNLSSDHRLWSWTFVGPMVLIPACFSPTSYCPGLISLSVSSALSAPAQCFHFPAIEPTRSALPHFQSSLT